MNNCKNGRRLQIRLSYILSRECNLYSNNNSHIFSISFLSHRKRWSSQFYTATSKKVQKRSNNINEGVLYTEIILTAVDWGNRRG